MRLIRVSSLYGWIRRRCGSVGPDGLTAFREFFWPLVSSSALPQDHGKTSSAKTEALSDGSSHRHFGAIRGYAKILAEDPHLAGSVFYLIDTTAQCSKRVRDPAGNGDLAVHIAARIPIDFFDAGSAGTSGQGKCRHNENCQYHSGSGLRHASSCTVQCEFNFIVQAPGFLARSSWARVLACCACALFPAALYASAIASNTSGLSACE